MNKMIEMKNGIKITDDPGQKAKYIHLYPYIHDLVSYSP